MAPGIEVVDVEVDVVEVVVRLREVMMVEEIEAELNGFIVVVVLEEVVVWVVPFVLLAARDSVEGTAASVGDFD